MAHDNQTYSVQSSRNLAKTKLNKPNNIQIKIIRFEVDMIHCQPMFFVLVFFRIHCSVINTKLHQLGQKFYMHPHPMRSTV